MAGRQGPLSRYGAYIDGQDPGVKLLVALGLFWVAEVCVWLVIAVID